ncbi:uncharacterized protein LOC143301299 [Babylonia areolata]|uniref:uncharacterized protein LOC143301299 n=1 Tax=Babylonia areolata TaxID=304850 RepID=UPI003FCF6846
MRWTTLAVLVAGLWLLCSVQSVHTCGRRRHHHPPPPPPNKNPKFTSECNKDITRPATKGKIGTVVSWPDSKIKAYDEDWNLPLTVVDMYRLNGSYFDRSTIVGYKVVDTRNGFDYCFFKVQVTVKYCTPVPYLQFGSRDCDGDVSNVYGSRCTFSCQQGYELHPNNPIVECLENKQWSPSIPTCQPKPCGQPGAVQNGNVLCPYGHGYTSTCIVQCDQGYRYQSPFPLIRCQKNGHWQPLLECRDEEKPKFPNGCPQYLTINSGPLGSSVPVTWSDPETSDNSNQGVTLTSSPSKGTSLPPGHHLVTITATDNAGNSDTCYFNVQVEVWSCQAIQIPYGTVSCTHSFMVGSQCSVTCNEGYTVNGSPIVACVPTAQGEGWNPAQTFCEVVQCPQLSLDHGSFICPNGRTYSRLCIPFCDSGFTYDGLPYVQCSATGSWTGLGQCNDVKPPEFPNGCPEDVYIYAASVGQDTQVTWSDPQVTDNSGPSNPVQLSCSPPPGSVFPIGVTSVKYNATDTAGNTKTCSFSVTVSTLLCDQPDFEQGKAQKRMTYNCPDGFVYGASCALNCSSGYPLVGDDTITCARNDQTYPPTMFWEWSGPSTVQPECAENSCPDLEPPYRGALTCNMGNFGWDCLMSCQKPYDLPGNIGDGHFYCTNSNGYWIPDVVPGCTETRRPHETTVHGDLFYYTDSCPNSTDALKQNFITRMTSSNILRDACVNVPTCTVENVVVHCGAFRRKRDVDGHKDSLDIEDQHHISQRAAGVSSPYYLSFQFEVRLNLSANGSISDEEIYQATQQTAGNIENNMKAAAQNGTFDIDEMYLDPSYGVGTTTVSANCNEGYVFRKHDDHFACVGCGSGLYLSQGVCTDCPVGTYSHMDNATQCTPCPVGMSTLTTGSKSSSDCLVKCSTGHSSPNSFMPCQVCQVGQYQSGEGAVTCQPCPVNRWTHNVAATSLQECVEADLMLTNSNVSGSINGTWSSLTVSLRVGFPSENSSVTVSIESSVDGSVLASHTLSGLSKVDEVRESKQRLSHHFMFTVTSPGETPPLQNIPSLALTQQPPQSTRLTVHSEQRRVMVSSLAVYGKTLTTQEVDSLAASCPVGVADNLLTLTPSPGNVVVPSACDAVDECSSDPCGDHGVCLNQRGGFECQCQDEWSGTLCDVPPDPCNQHQCQNGATCVPGAGNYTCACSFDYTGVLCEQEKVHGGWTEWLSWTPCACGTEQMRQRLCTNPAPQNGGNNCSGSDTETASCSGSVCFVNVTGTWSSWGAWTDCSATCEGGQATRQRMCQPANGTTGQAICDGIAQEVQACSIEACPVDGGWGRWLAWLPCSVTCGSGTQSRQRSCDSPVPALGGANCSGSDTDTQVCQQQDCRVCGNPPRTAGSYWKCVESQSPFLKTCTLQCIPGYRLAFPASDFYCGEQTGHQWNNEISEGLSSAPPSCSPARVVQNGLYSSSAIMKNVPCDPSTASEVKSGVTSNINQQVPCRSQNTCNVRVTTGCSSTSRKRSTPSLQVFVTATMNSNISDSDLENNNTQWEDYQDMMSVLNQSVPDEATLQSLLTVTLSGGQAAQPDMSTVLVDVNITCSAGLIFRDDVCVECPAGSMKESETACVLCPLGTYQDQLASTSCKPCPTGMTWYLLGAVSELQCVEELSTTTAPPTTTPWDDGGHDPFPMLIIGLVTGAIVLLFVILAVVLRLYCTHSSSNRRGRESRPGSQMSMSKVHPLVHSPVPAPFYEGRAPPSYHEAVEAGIAPLRHTAPRDHTDPTPEGHNDPPSRRNTITTSFATAPGEDGDGELGCPSPGLVAVKE